MIRVLDLFSGIGGFSHALDRIEHNGQKVFETVAFCEWDEECKKVLEKHWPDVVKFGDVTKLNATKMKRSNTHFLYSDETTFNSARGGKALRINIDEKSVEQKIDMIVGGFPCQDISTAGLQKGLKDESGEATRSGLWFQYKRLIEEIKPRWVVIENVRNLLSNGLATVLQDLHEIGYDAEWEIISARDIGACHLRERVWIVAYPNGSSVRNNEQRNTLRRIGVQDEGEALTGHSGETGSHSTSNSDEQRLEGTEPIRREVVKLQLLSNESDATTNTNDFRFWPTFASEEEKSKWWATSTSGLRDWWEVASPICRVDDDVSYQLHEGESEKERRARIKQLGNSIVPGIVSIIGERIKHHEFNEEAQL